jgi:hypothetical protein
MSWQSNDRRGRHSDSGSEAQEGAGNAVDADDTREADVAGEAGSAGPAGEAKESIEISRRHVLTTASAAAALLLLGNPWTMPELFAADLKLSPAAFTTNPTGDGIIGPFGEVRIFAAADGSLPVIVTAVGGLAEMNMSARTPFVRLGAAGDETAILLTSAGIQYGKGKVPQAWSATSFRQLIAFLTKDRKKARGLILLRSALHSAYPVAVQRKKAKVGKKMSASFSKHSSDFGAQALICTTKTVTDTVTHTITETVEVIKTAEKQYQECYDKAATRDPCKSLGILAGACAAATCAATTFVDMVIGFVDVVTTTTEEVVRTVVSCAPPLPGTWPSPWDLPDAQLKLAVPQQKTTFGQKDIDGGLKLLKQIGGFFGPFATCMISGKWSLAQLDTQMDFGNGNVVIPYGIKVCITSQCATQLSLDNIIGEYATAVGAALGALAALSPEVAAALGPLGIAPAAAVTAAIAGLPEVVITIAALILAFVLIALFWAGALAGQLFFYKTFTDALDDGLVCIEHPTFALALIAMLPLPGATVSAAIVPPIVTG